MGERLQAVVLVLADPAFGNFVNRHGVEVMQLFAPAPDRDDEVRLLQQGEVFGHGLPGHVEVRAQLAQGLAAFEIKSVEQFSPARIRECFEYFVHGRKEYMQLSGCMARRFLERSLIPCLEGVE